MAKNNGALSGKILVATVMGILLGVSAGLIFAPQSGKQTQKTLLDTYEKTEEKVTRVVKKADNQVSGIVAKLTSETNDLPAEVESEVSRITGKAESTFTRTIEQGSAFLHELTGTVTASFQEGKKKLLEKKEQYL